MKIQSAFHMLPGLLRCAVLVLAPLAPFAVSAQFFQDNPDWKESEAPPPPAYDASKLLNFKVSGGQSLVYGVDPASITINKSDSVVRYVMVATSATGARNVMYEGLHCATGEVKIYARQFAGKWEPIANPKWQSVFGEMPSKHAFTFARMGACDGAAPASSVTDLVAKVKTHGQYLDQ
ncbi:MAG: CNP1-like family protein [Pseudomonadota bacterium]